MKYRVTKKKTNAWPLSYEVRINGEAVGHVLAVEGTPGWWARADQLGIDLYNSWAKRDEYDSITAALNAAMGYVRRQMSKKDEACKKTKTRRLTNAESSPVPAAGGTTSGRRTARARKTKSSGTATAPRRTRTVS